MTGVDGPTTVTGRRPGRIPVVLRDRSFRRYWTAQSLSYVGDQVTMVALPLTAVLALDASAVDMGLLWTLESLPLLLFSLHAGAWVDRRGRRRRIMISTDLARAVLLGSVPVAYLVGALTLPYVYAVAFLVGALAVLFNVSSYSLFPAMVPREHFVAGTSLTRGSFSFALVAGPGVGGVLVQIVSAPVTILLDALSFVVSAVLLRSVDVTEPEGDPTEARGYVWEGLRFVRRTPALLAKFVAGAGLNFFYSVYFTLLFLFAARELGLSAGMIGLVISVGAVGALVGSAVTTWTSGRIGLGATFIVGSFLYPAALVLTPLATGDRWLVVTMLLVGEFVSAVGLMLCDISGTSIQQALTPDVLRSRVQGAHLAVNYGARPLGSLVAGGMGTWLGLRPTMWIAVVGGAASVLFLFWSPIPRMRELPVPPDDHRRPVPEEAS
ncbi:MFS transporter [Micromonospora sp. NPDC023956]|uniref:MFS transporter n=1 Tax=Micromonospora sp. NPDC023956 TaxID=3155722 RepID=UPI0033E9D254